MLYDINNANYIEDFKIKITFENGKEGIVDLKEYPKRGGIFASLADLNIFKQVKVNPEIGTICWPNGADIAPETLYKKIK
ncbi:DUF2442 domain-containing protein [Candidatus Margulisiibacteriota bacterium]